MMGQASSLFVVLFKRECLLQLRQMRLLINSFLFFLMLLLFFPLTLRPEIAVLRSTAPGLVWVAMLLSALFSAERVFQLDYEQGVMEQWVVSGFSLTLMISAKVLAQTVMHLLPVLLVSPLIALVFSLNSAEVIALVLSLLCGTPTVFFLCAFAAALGLGVNQKGAFMALIVLPLTLPVLIFGSGSVVVAMQGLPYGGYLALLLAMSVLSMGLLPFALSGVIRINHSC